MFWHADFPRLNDCVVTKQMFCVILLCLFSIKFRCSVSTVGFSNEDNCCQLQEIGKFIKEKLLTGVFRQVYCYFCVLNICEQKTNFFYKSSAFWSNFFSEIMLESWGCGLYTSAAYTRVFTVLLGVGRAM